MVVMRLERGRPGSSPARKSADLARAPTRRPGAAADRGAARGTAPAGARACRARRVRIRSRSEPTRSARSSLLTTSRSLRVIPGPPLRGMSSPPATSITKICTSASAGLKIAVRLSPPLSTSTRSSGARPRSSSATASRLAETSSRIAVCGQPPVSTARIRSARQHAGAAQEERVLGRVDVVRHDADARARRRARGRAPRRASSCRSRPGRRCRSAARAQVAKSLPSRAAWASERSSSAGAKPAGSARGSSRPRARRELGDRGAASTSQRRRVARRRPAAAAPPRRSTVVASS